MISAMSSAGPTRTVSSMYESVFTSEVFSRTALCITSVMANENTNVLSGSPWGSPVVGHGQMIAVRN